MNRTFRFVIAGLLAFLVVAVAVNVWASPGKTGTVPVPPSHEFVGGDNSNGNASCKTVNMVTAVFTIFPPDNNNYVCAVTNVTNPNPDEYGPAPKDTVFYGDVFKFLVILEDVEVVDIPTEVCYAYPPEFEQKEAQIYTWDTDANEWNLVLGDGNGTPDGGVASGEPKQICVTSPRTGIFSLIGKP